MKTWALLVLSLQLFVSRSVAQPTLDAAFSSERLKRIDRLFDQYMEEKKIAGAVALVLHDGKPVYERAAG